MRLGRRSAWAVALAALLLASLGMASPAAASGPHVKVIASGLDNPRGITVDRHGRVLVAAAGQGGPGGFGSTGKIIRISKGGVHVYRDGLPSAMSPEGEVSGVHNVAVGPHGRVYGVIGAGGPSGVDPRFSTLMRLSQGGESIRADFQAFRNTHPDLTDLDNPPNPFDTNVYGLALLKNGKHLVTDAGGNELLLVDSKGRVKTVAKFPNAVVGTGHLPPGLGLPPELPAEAVPTSVAVGPDGYWYVGELKGFPFTPGASRIWRIAPWARNVVCDPTAKHGPCRLFADGFTSIVGLAFGPRGDLYVVEIVKAGVLNLFIGGDATGALWRVKHGHKTEIAEGRLTAPGGVAVSRHGTIYVTNFSVSVGGGEVLKIRR